MRLDGVYVLTAPAEGDQGRQAMAEELLYEGKAKRIYASDHPDQVVMEFKDDATALNGQKRATIEDKGIINRAFTARVFRYLEEQRIPTHLLAEIDQRRLLVRRLTMIGLEVVVRNRVAGSLAARTGLAEGTVLDRPIVEFYLKDDALGDPLLNDDHIRVLGIADEETVLRLRQMAIRINRVLQEFLAARAMILVDFKLEFGRPPGGEGEGIVLADEITPDTCRLWDRTTLEKLDKDRFRRDMGGVIEGYREAWRRVRQ